jgi:hypothetical protein
MFISIERKQPNLSDPFLSLKIAGCSKSLMTTDSACVVTDTRTQMHPMNKKNLFTKKEYIKNMIKFIYFNRRITRFGLNCRIF